MNNTSAVFSGTTLPSTFAMLQKVVDLLKVFVSSFITMFTLPYPLIQLFYTHWTLPGFVTLKTYDLRTPFFIRKPSNNLLFHLGTKLDNFMLNKVSWVRFRFALEETYSPAVLPRLAMFLESSRLTVEGSTPMFAAIISYFIPALIKASI